MKNIYSPFPPFSWFPRTQPTIGFKLKFRYLLHVPLHMFLYSKKSQAIALIQWRRQGGTQGTPPPRNWKNCCRKMMVFPKALFLATTFPKIDKNSIFLMKFYQKMSKFSQNFPTICIFRPNAQKINAEFLKFCWE